MKIALASPNESRLQEMGSALAGKSHIVITADLAKTKMRQVAEQEQPDLLLVDDGYIDPQLFTQVEYVTTHYPKTVVILLSSIHTPEFLLDAMRAGVREVLPSPVSPRVLEEAVSRVAAKLPKAHEKGNGKVLAFMPCKGGSGATFLATNLGYQLAEKSKVLLIDLNLQFGDALSFLYDAKPPSTLASVAKEIRRLDASFLAASTVRITENYGIIAAPEDPSDAVEVQPAHIDAILNLAITQYDFILLDMNRTIDPVSIKALDHADRIFPVLQAGLPYLKNARKLLETFIALGYPAEKIELIVNRFDKRGDIGIDDIRRLAGAVRMHTVPNSFRDVSASINQGNPLIKIARSNTVSKILNEFSLALNPGQEEARGFLGRFLKRA